MTSQPKPFLLLQARDENDPIKQQEVDCFLRALECSESDLDTKSLFHEAEPMEVMQLRKAIFVGGSGDYSIARGGDWLSNALHWMRAVAGLGHPTFASCFGFQAMSLALGGVVVTDLSRAEVGTIELHCTDVGREDPLFAPLPDPFLGQAGHQDIVERLPVDAVLLATNERTHNQAFRLNGKPIYCSQFHPELSLEALLQRIQNYPEYVEKIAGIPYQEFADSCREASDSTEIMRRFLKRFVH